MQGIEVTSFPSQSPSEYLLMTKKQPEYEVIGELHKNEVN